MHTGPTPTRVKIAGDGCVTPLKNTLWHGDNLDVLRQMPANSVDLVYLDPPFKSNQDYNMLYKERDGTRSAAQTRAFTDT